MLSSSDLQPVRSFGFSNQYQKIHTDTSTSHRISGVSDKFGDSTDTNASGEAEENSAQCQMVVATSVNHSAGSSPLRGQNHRFIQSSMASPLHYRGIQALMNSVFPETEDNSGLTSRFNVKLPLSVELPFELLLTDVLLLELLLTDAMATDNPDSPDSPSACFDHKHYHYVFSQALSPCKISAKSFMSGKVIAERLYFFECICGKDVYICM